LGELKLPDRMTNKTVKYTESEFSAMQRHPTLGHDMLKRDPSVPEDVRMAVLHHHERLDGSGYPAGHVGRFIHPLGKVIAVTEAFDAMTTKRTRAEAVTPNEALKAIYALAGKQYEGAVIKTLITLLGLYPMGSLVRLSGNQLGVVLQQNKADLAKPQVIVITDGSGQPIDPYVINLFNDKGGRKILFAENADTMCVNTNMYITQVLEKNAESSQISNKEV
jgi:HD-GYP domain-containing protein (c-di-GMP phosphodiesterase class II)